MADPADASGGSGDGGGGSATHVDYLVEVPSGAAYLLLSFSTVTEQVVEALVTLFDAIAMSLRWVW